MRGATARPRRRSPAAAPLLTALMLSVAGNLVAAVFFSTALVRTHEPPPEPVVVALIEEPAPPAEAEPPVTPPSTPAPTPETAPHRLPQPDPAEPAQLPPAPEPPAPTEPPPAPQPAPEPEPAPEPAPPAEPTPPPPERDRAQSVAQAVSNDEEAPDARFLAERANRVARETQAELTSLDSPSQLPELSRAPPVANQPLDASREETQPAPRPADLVAAATAPRQPSRQAQPARPAREAVPETAPPPVPAPPAPPVAEPDRAGSDPPPAPLAPMSLAEAMRRAADAEPGAAAVAAVAATDYQAYVGTFADREDADRARLAAAARAGALGGDHEARWDRTRAALENFDVLVEPGQETGLNTRSDAYAAYIHAVHNAIHPHWASYLNHLDFQQGPLGPLADPSLYVVLEFAIAADGVVRDVRIRRTSGRIEFDAEAIDIIWRISPQRSPPEVTRSADGLTYIRWEMHRDAQMCHSSGASIHLLAAD